MTNIDEKISLEPCPFCGGEVTLSAVTGSYLYWSVNCDSCNIKMESRTNKNWPGSECLSSERRDKLVSAWNTRLTPRHCAV